MLHLGAKWEFVGLYPSLSESWYLSVSSSASGSSSNVGARGDVLGRPDLVKAPVFLRNVVRASISLVPRMSSGCPLV